MGFDKSGKVRGRANDGGKAVSELESLTRRASCLVSRSAW